MLRTMKAIVVVVALAIVLLHGTEATLYTVGDDLGWAIPPGGAGTYTAWALMHTFVVNDELEFNFKVGEQDLVIVTAEDYDSCNTADPLYQSQEPITLQAIASGTFYFTSSLAGHCAKGQKIAIYFGDAVSPSPSPTPCLSSAQDFPADSPKFVAHRIMSKGN